LKITATPNGSWSGLYVTESSTEGFTVKSGAGDPDAQFDWIAIGRRKGYEVTENDIIPAGRAAMEQIHRKETERVDVETLVRMEQESQRPVPGAAPALEVESETEPDRKIEMERSEHDPENLGPTRPHDIE
jgi:hypothetical protein